MTSMHSINPTPLLERYRRAALWTPPRLAARTPAIAVDGYWVDANLFYFLSEQVEPALGRVVGIPSVLDSGSGVVSQVMPLATLANVLAEYSVQPVDLDAVSTAIIDMPDRHTLGVSIRGRDYLVNLRKQRVIEERVSMSVPALYSPDGRYACFVRGFNLWLMDRDSGAENPLTHDGVLHNSYGQQTETALSAISYRRRPKPMGLWSADSEWFLTHRIDERQLPELCLIQNSGRDESRPQLHSFKYPFPGDPLPVATYFAIHIPSGRTVIFDDFPECVCAFSPFSTRRVWFDRSNGVWIARLDRYSKQAELINLDLATGAGRIVVSETVASGYIDLNPSIVGSPNVRSLPDSKEVIWYSERDGWGHLYLYDAQTCALKNQITKGEWLVTDIVHVDVERRLLLFLASGLRPGDDPARKRLCSVALDGSGFELLLEHEGDVFVATNEPCGLEQDRPFRPANAHAGVCADGRYGVVRYSGVNFGNRTEIVDLRTRQAVVIASTVPDSGEEPPRQFTALTADGSTRLHGVMFFPPEFDANRRYPLIDYMYPGPQIAWQPQSSNSLKSAQAKALAQLGFVTIMIDTRGLPIGSRAFHQVGYGELLEPQLADHAAVVDQLCTRSPFIDRDRIGIMGQSGGGAAAARALFDYGETFKVGVAVCGNHDSSYYTAVWSDKYRGPGTRDRFREQSNSAAAHKLKGKLLLVAGDMDENVHVSHTLSLVDALIRANRNFDLLIVPNQGHSILMTHGYVLRKLWDYFVRHLLGEEPPADFEIEFEARELDRYAARMARENRP